MGNKTEIGNIAHGIAVTVAGLGLAATIAGIGATIVEAGQTIDLGKRIIPQIVNVDNVINTDKNLNQEEQQLLNNGELLIFTALGSAALGAITLASASSLSKLGKNGY